MPHTSGKRYAVVSCHVERPLEDEAWARFSRLQARRPGGFVVAALLRPADPSAGEDEEAWVARAREAARRGPLGHHPHWTAPEHARPTAPGAAERVRSEGERLRALGVEPSLFCGGGWYTDAEVAEVCAELGYADCTPRARRPPALVPGGRWAELERPARIRLPSGATLLALPTTHSLGDLARALVQRALPTYVHLYFHDTDLLDRRRRALVEGLLPALGRLAARADLGELAEGPPEPVGEVAWADVARL
ncbi:MAG: hypothetical protein NZL88_01525 [Gaiellaceae bacterium]|nr:hypothetical protein [Gaiellaceae bacterium]